MSCPGDDTLARALAGELTDGERAALERHLVGCLDCEQQLERDRQVRAAVRRLSPTTKAPRALESRLLAALEASAAAESAPQAPPGPEATGRPRRGLRRWLPAAAALLLALTLGWWLNQPRWSPVQDMVNKHLHYQLQLLATGEGGWQRRSPDRAELARWASSELGAEVRFPQAVEGWTIEGVRTERVQGAPAMLAFCRDSRDQPASVFALPGRPQRPEPGGAFTALGQELLAAGPGRWVGTLRLPQRVDPDQRLFDVELIHDAEAGLIYGIIRTVPEVGGSR